MRIDWFAWQEKSTRRIYPLYRRMHIKNFILSVLEDEYKNFSIYKNSKLIASNINEDAAIKICNDILNLS